jgi:hypothetical protein
VSDFDGEGAGVSRRIGGAALVALWVSITPVDARAPRATAGTAGWDLFAAERLLSRLRARDDHALLADPPGIRPSRPLAATPEPGTALLAALGLAALTRLRVKKGAGLDPSTFAVREKS